uniref:RanBP2-type domain-containing protein n=1 Tax=Branchiostoma floridae TaxID=7739 RepID=C3XWK9_BRAFL|eukprot:XP_002611733.1 hypothetical protein BRAFLDRAFT_98696 [Branchiostoma floridae]
MGTVVSSSTWQCPQCTLQNDGTTQNCRSCGEARADTAGLLAALFGGGTKVCPGCDLTNAAEVEKCGRCGFTWPPRETQKDSMALNEVHVLGITRAGAERRRVPIEGTRRSPKATSTKRSPKATSTKRSPKATSERSER